MTRPNRWLVLPLAVTLLATLSCTADTPTAPVAPPEQSLLGGLLSYTGLLSCKPMPTSTATATIGPEGGTITVVTAGDVDNIDPGIAYYSFTYEITYATQRPLYAYKPTSVSPRVTS